MQKASEACIVGGHPYNSPRYAEKSQGATGLLTPTTPMTIDGAGSMVADGRREK